ncbi:MAG: alpha/beta hydrolase [Clostridia bacterium]|nr:alpha/beta hydrolase [Clostridia bacterium]
MKKRKILLGAGAISAVTAALVGAEGYRQACIKRPKPKIDKDPKRMLRAEIRKKNNSYLYSLNPEDLEIISKDNLRLKAWYVPAEKETKRFAICVHGHNCNGPDECSHLLPFYRNTMGFNYLLPDLRGHGRSDGNLIGFGALDYKDIKLWIDYLIERFGEDIQIVLHGISMGAATVMLVNNTNPQRQVKAVIEDCGYTNAFEQVVETMKGMGLAHTANFFTEITNIYCRKISKYDLKKDADPLGTMPNAVNPVMFIHGEEDKLVPFPMCQKLYDACPVDKEIFTVPGAVHAYSYYDAKDEYDRRVKAFIEKYL